MLENLGADAKTIVQKIFEKVSERISYEYRMLPEEYYADNFAKLIVFIFPSKPHISFSCI